MKRLRGCQQETVERRYWHRFPVGGFTLKRCPLAVVSRRALRAIQLLSAAESGLLPEHGGLLDQPAAAVEAMAFISRLKLSRSSSNV